MAKSKLTPEQKRDNAIETARELLSMNLLILDTETTGMSSEDQVIELGIIDGTGKIVANTLVNTDRAIDKYAYQVHHITKHLLLSSDHWGIIDAQVKATIDMHDIVVMYNAPFDIRLMAQSADYFGLDGSYYKEAMHYQCLMQLFKQYNYDKKLPLAKALAARGIKPRAEHRAVADCQDTLALLKYMAKSSTVHELEADLDGWPPEE
jgi:DNA polymerase-3 subunit epsilon